MSLPPSSLSPFSLFASGWGILPGSENGDSGSALSSPETQVGPPQTPETNAEQAAPSSHELVSENQRLREENAELRREQGDMVNTLIDLDEAIKTRDRAIETLTRTIEELRKVSAGRQDGIMALTVQLQTAEAKIARNRRAMAEQEGVITVLTAELRKLRWAMMGPQPEN